MKFKDFIEKGKKTESYKDFKKIENDLNYYRDYIQPMNDAQGNTLRHLAGSAGFAQKHGFWPTMYYGTGKEVDDLFFKHKGLSDTIGDMKNNLYGALIGTTMKAEEPITLYDRIFKGYIEK